jgi:hypothetical protein
MVDGHENSDDLHLTEIDNKTRGKYQDGVLSRSDHAETTI